MRAHDPFWPRRLPRSLTIPATTLWHYLATSAERYPTKPAIHFLGNTLSYEDLVRQAELIAAALVNMGVQPGDRVLLDMQNCTQLVVSHWGILRSGAVVVPVNPMSMAEELKHYIVDSGAKVGICMGELARELAKGSNALPAGQGLQGLLVTQWADSVDLNAVEDDAVAPAWRAWLTARHELPELRGGTCVSWQDALQRKRGAPPPLPDRSDAMALLPYTSGTTGLPKGCVHAHSSLLHNALGAAAWGGLTSEAVLLAAVPMFHITGIVGVMYQAATIGATLVVLPRWDRDVAGRAISRWKVTHWLNIPTMVIDLLASPNADRFDLSSLTYIGGGGAAMPQAVAQRLFEKYDLVYCESYGLTEMAAPTHNNPYDRPKQQCLGIPFISTEARVVDPVSLEELAPGEPGEIIVRGPGAFQGYWKQPEATKAAFVEVDGRSWFRTGDIGKVDEEGYFYLTDRLKRMINASGFKVWPAEVEALLYRHPAIQEACVISMTDAYRGESVKAVVVLRAGHEGTTQEQIINWCRENMAAYKVPRAIRFASLLPKTASGKVMWRQLQEQEQEHVPHAARDSNHSTIAKQGDKTS
jgi:fatty-acyl-CoA synthase